MKEEETRYQTLFTALVYKPFIAVQLTFERKEKNIFTPHFNRETHTDMKCTQHA